ncbi:MAG TPA: hypothetical protein VMV83_02235 [Rectinemataceae bacterium]|nr:hypothetical protein [Rectinemataceae bacterium]
MKLCYSPWVWLALDQSLFTAADGTAFDTPTTKHAWQGSSFNSFGVLVNAGLNHDLISLDLTGSLEGNLFRYEYLQIGGGVGTQAAWNLDGTIDLFLSFPRFMVSGIVPRLGLGWLWTGSADQLNGTWADTQTIMRLNFGFRGRT